MSRNIHRAFAVLTSVGGLLACGATSAQADGAGGTGGTGTGRDSVLQPALERAIETVQGGVPAVPEGSGVGVPSLAPGVPSVSVLPLSVPELPVTPEVPQIPGVPTLPGNPADLPGMLPLP
ncbi:hypothetical protein LHJ74_20960 [Streptomyces sp. N2-109]|uniref:Lipoprotein n=1 Tax=Streptomyces gossypii TaxID=2883101 RepID=A0ABT2JYL8_9ACTN|nr:hypothetical protein [Streptomyces gossypii]MCT2592344.1 hypothetical protein [Streptomyces gossypii]